MPETWDAYPLQVQDELAGLGVPQPQDNVLGNLAFLPYDLALGREAVLVLRVDRLHHCAVRDIGQVLLGDLDEVEDGELCIAHAVILGESIMVKDFNLNRDRPVCDRQGEVLVPLWVDGFIFDTGLYFLHISRKKNI